MAKGGPPAKEKAAKPAAAAPGPTKTKVAKATKPSKPAEVAGLSLADLLKKHTVGVLDLDISKINVDPEHLRVRPTQPSGVEEMKWGPFIAVSNSGSFSAALQGPNSLCWTVEQPRPHSRKADEYQAQDGILPP